LPNIEGAVFCPPGQHYFAEGGGAVPVYRYRYGTGALHMELPAGDIVQVLIPKRQQSLFSDPAAIIRHALANPIDASLLGELAVPGERICLVVNDITRPTGSEILVPFLVEELNRAGVPDGDITIVFANGLHRPMERQEMEQVIGRELLARLRTVQHHAVTGEFVYRGRTSRGNAVYINREVAAADRVILVGGICLHHLAGYGGGGKSIVPGVARAETILFNHRMVVDPGAAAGSTTGNPVYADLIEACTLVDPDFLCNVILDAEGQITTAVAGHWRTAHAAGCAPVDKLYKVPLAERADLVIAGGGGFPRDIDLRQSKKAYYNAARAVKPGGVIITIAACSRGISREGDPFEDWLRRYWTLAEIRTALVEEFSIGGLSAYRTREVQARARLILISDIDPVRLSVLHVEAYGSHQLQQVIDRVRADLGGNPRIILMPHAALTLPV
jgi:nickel-dependent lactate racemase